MNRYPPHGRRASPTESGIKWDRIRAPPVDSCPHDLHVSECLNELQPGDHVEIQWRRNKEFPYGIFHIIVQNASVLSISEKNLILLINKCIHFIKEQLSPMCLFVARKSNLLVSVYHFLRMGH